LSDFAIRDTNRAKTKNINEALLVEKKLPVLLKGKNSIKKIIKNVKVF
jgi:hypothetical protein